MPVTVREASAPEDYAAFADLIREYEGWLASRYAEQAGLVATIRSHQDIEGELADLPHKYAPPRGIVLLAQDEQGRLLGGVACRDLHDGTCEMKRLFVRDGARGTGAGRLLCERLLAWAGAAGYSAMRLDTGSRNTEAMALYRDLGFVGTEPYADYPAEVAPHLLFFERRLP